jgi:two-component system, NtrC family, nitrogen regulation response regulator NtrX
LTITSINNILEPVPSQLARPACRQAGAERSMKKILVVDDEESVRFILKQMLEKGGYAVEVKNDGEEAMEALKKGCFDMLITDINMPKMNGIELLYKAKEAFHELPVIFISAYGKDKTILEAMKMGLSDNIEKPFRMDDVLEIVKEHIK